jgi:organic radical activating enzyme
MPKCLMFKHGVTIGPSGSVRPCCMYDNIDMPWNYNEDGWREEFDRLYEESVSSDEWNPRCHECKTEEEENGWSLRTEANQRFNENSTGTRYWDLKINNTCNLMCRMCSPNNSSTWKTQVKESGHDDWVPFIKREMTMRTGWHRDLLPKMINNLRDTEVIKFTGGEPMLVPHVKKILQYCIDQGVADCVEIKLTTNCTVDPDNGWFDLFDHFRQVHFSMSCDGIGDRFNYVRAGADWNIVSENMLKFSNYKNRHPATTCNLTFLPMSINAACESELKQWCRDNKINFHRSPECWRPDYLSYATLDYDLRKRYNVKSDTTFNPELIAKLHQQMKLIDDLYNTDFKTACPEFFE